MVMAEIKPQAITGVAPPEKSEVMIRERYPSVASMGAIATLGRKLTGTIILAPLAWLIMAGPFFGKLLPLIGRRYAITNRRVMIRKGWKGTPGQEVKLSDIDDVRMVTNSNSDFFRAGDLEIISGGKVAFTLRGVPEPESFLHSILNARNAWAPGKARTLPFVPSKS